MTMRITVRELWYIYWMFNHHGTILGYVMRCDSGIILGILMYIMGCHVPIMGYYPDIDGIIIRHIGFSHQVWINIWGKKHLLMMSTIGKRFGRVGTYWCHI